MKNNRVKWCNSQLTVHMAEEERNVLQYVANKRGMSLSRYILIAAMSWARNYNADIFNEYTTLKQQQNDLPSN